MVSWHIGCSGFYYKDWKEMFYPTDLPQTKWFSYYCENFQTLELNVTFYRFPQLSTLQSWYTKSPQDFCFAVKAPRLITHYKQFIDTKEVLNSFYNTIGDGLQNKLGCVLFQLPPRMNYTDERLERIIENLNPSFLNVLEFRHTSWWDESVYKKLANHTISFCSMGHPDLPNDVIQTTPVVYCRFHGVPELYKSEYDLSFLRQIANEITSSSKTKKAFIYFNNDIGGSAIINARQMLQLI